MNFLGFVSRRQFYKAILRKEEEADELREELRLKRVTVSLQEREINRLKLEIATLNASLDATTDALAAAQNALKISEQGRKRLLNEKKRRAGYGH
jgi:hypothetical protein